MTLNHYFLSTNVHGQQKTKNIKFHQVFQEHWRDRGEGSEGEINLFSKIASSAPRLPTGKKFAYSSYMFN